MMRTRALTALLATGAAAIAVGVGAPAYAATARTAGPAATPSDSTDFICPDRSICLFPDLNGTGNYPGGSPVVVPTPGNGGIWWSFSDWGASNPNPGSLHDNSGSVVFVYDKAQNILGCIDAGGKVNLYNDYGYFDIDYGVALCANAGYPLPLP